MKRGVACVCADDNLMLFETVINERRQEMSENKD